MHTKPCIFTIAMFTKPSSTQNTLDPSFSVCQLPTGRRLDDGETAPTLTVRDLSDHPVRIVSIHNVFIIFTSHGAWLQHPHCPQHSELIDPECGLT